LDRRVHRDLRGVWVSRAIRDLTVLPVLLVQLGQSGPQDLSDPLDNQVPSVRSETQARRVLLVRSAPQDTPDFRDPRDPWEVTGRRALQAEPELLALRVSLELREIKDWLEVRELLDQLDHLDLQDPADPADSLEWLELLDPLVALDQTVQQDSLVQRVLRALPGRRVHRAQPVTRDLSAPRDQLVLPERLVRRDH